MQWNCVQTKLAELFIAGGERLCSHCRHLFDPHQRKLCLRGSVGTNLDDSVGSKKEPHSHHCILCSLSFPEKKCLLPDFEPLEAEGLSGSTLALGRESGKGSPWTTIPLWQTCSAFSSLYRQNNWFSLWKVQYLIKNSCTFLRFISIFIWISIFPDAFKYFQGKVCSDNKIPGMTEPFFCSFCFLSEIYYLKRAITIGQRKTSESCGKVCYLIFILVWNSAKHCWDFFKNECYPEENLYKPQDPKQVSKEPSSQSWSALEVAFGKFWRMFSQAATGWPGGGSSVNTVKCSQEKAACPVLQPL